MSRATILIFALISVASLAYGTNCPPGPSDNFFKQLTNSCPRPILDSDDKSFCCSNLKDGSTYCCDNVEWVMTTAGKYGLVSSSGHTAKLHQTSNILLFSYFIYLIAGQLSSTIL